MPNVARIAYRVVIVTAAMASAAFSPQNGNEKFGAWQPHGDDRMADRRVPDQFPWWGMRTFFRGGMQKNKIIGKIRALLCR
jgi:hypothetical protein